MRTEQKNEESIFYAALEIESSEKRSTYLKRACGSDAHLMARVEALLAVQEKERSILEDAAPFLGTTLQTVPVTEGPGAVIGNTIFGNPNDITTWTFGIPSIWAWHIIFWALGVVMMWFLAYKMQMSTMPETEIVALVEDIGDAKKARLDLDKP